MTLDIGRYCSGPQSISTSCLSYKASCSDLLCLSLPWCFSLAQKTPEAVNEELKPVNHEPREVCFLLQCFLEKCAT